jgi:hypothetical protein
MIVQAFNRTLHIMKKRLCERNTAGDQADGGELPAKRGLKPLLISGRFSGRQRIVEAEGSQKQPVGTGTAVNKAIFSEKSSGVTALFFFIGTREFLSA